MSKYSEFITIAINGIANYLSEAVSSARILPEAAQSAKVTTIANMEKWFQDDNIDRLSPSLKGALVDAIRQGQWESLVNAFRKELSFGTAGIRGMMAFDRESIVKIQKVGLDAPIIKGPNTINEIVLLRVSAGVAKFGRTQPEPFSKIVIGYDSRIRGHDFAAVVAKLFLAYNYQVYLFDEPCPYPEANFAIPFNTIQADLGILISASHNDYRYNGYKLSCGNSSQFNPEQRDRMYNDFIVPATTDDIKFREFHEATDDQLLFLGGKEPLENVNYHGKRLINIHDQHRDHVRGFLRLDQFPSSKLRVGYCAFHGAGRKAVPRLLEEIGVLPEDILKIEANDLGKLNGLFPSFCSDPGKEKQPDPGDKFAAAIEVDAFKQQYGPKALEQVDILLGTDPDADRCGVVVPLGSNSRHLYRGQDWTLLSADDLWTVLLWYNLEMNKTRKAPCSSEEAFVVLSNTTSDSITLLARKHGIGVVKSWVGFAALAAAVQDVWEAHLGVSAPSRTLEPLATIKDGRSPTELNLCDLWVFEHQGMVGHPRCWNLAAMEQSNGFSILGGPPADIRSLGQGGHVRDKDGTLACVLIAEVAAWAKANHTTLVDLLNNEVFADPAVGVFANDYAQGPDDGEYPGIEGDQKKLRILKRAVALHYTANAGDLMLGNRKVSRAAIHRTGKYDRLYPPTYDFRFPDEGVRFYLDNDLNYTTVRPSGTQNALRFHTQLHEHPDSGGIAEQRARLLDESRAVTQALRILLKAED